MKKFLKLVAVISCISLAVCCFAGCGNDKTPALGTKAEDKLVIGTNAEFPPFEFVDAEIGVIDEFAGIDMEIANEIAKSINVKAEINNMDFDGLLLALGNGQVDMVIAGMTVTDERKEQVDFSEPYYTAKQVMIVPADSAIAKATDMEGKKIGVIDGYTGQTCVEDLGYAFSGYKKGTDAVLDVSNDKLDVVVIDSITAEKFIADNEGLKIVEDNDAFGAEEYAVAVKKGNTKLLDNVNKAIKEMKATGFFAGLKSAKKPLFYNRIRSMNL